MREVFQRAHLGVVMFDNERLQLTDIIGNALNGAGGVPLEVGCRYGRYLRRLAASGIDAIDVEVNPSIVEKNNAEGLRCMTPEHPRRWPNSRVFSGSREI